MTPLKKTIHNLAMYGGSVYNLVKEQTFKVVGIDIKDVALLSENGKVIFFPLDEFDKTFLPLLHSFSKLTEPVLDGKVPIVELFKIAGFKNYHENSYRIYEKVIEFKQEHSFLSNDGIYYNGVWLDLYGKVYFGYSVDFNCFCIYNQSTNHYHIPIEQKQLFDQLNIWGFNTENLPEDQFIEIETLKIK